MKLRFARTSIFGVGAGLFFYPRGIRLFWWRSVVEISWGLK